MMCVFILLLLLPLVTESLKLSPLTSQSYSSSSSPYACALLFPFPLPASQAELHTFTSLFYYLKAVCRSKQTLQAGHEVGFCNVQQRKEEKENRKRYYVHRGWTSPRLIPRPFSPYTQGLRRSRHNADIQLPFRAACNSLRLRYVSVFRGQFLSTRRKVLRRVGHDARNAGGQAIDYQMIVSPTIAQ